MGGDRILDVEDPKVTHYRNISISPYDIFSILGYVFFKIQGRGGNAQIIYRLFSQADEVVISPSGANIGIYQDERLLFLIYLAIILKKHPVFHLCTIGKSNSFLFDFVALLALKKTQNYVRERRLQTYLMSHNIQCEFGVDTAFALSCEDKKVSDQFLETYIGDSIVVIITNLGWHPLHRDKNAEIVIERIITTAASLAKKTGKKIMLLPHCLTKEDAVLLDYVKDKLDGCCSVLHVSSVNEYNYSIKYAAIVITMRYHGAVLSIKNNVPFVAISYENKLEEVCKYSNCGECCINIADIIEDASSLNRAISLVCENSDEIKKKMQNFMASELISTTDKPVLGLLS